jgi:teichoic acid transport system ATP-binding protein
MAFQTKARERMKALMSNARVVIVVSHDLKSLPLLCDKAMWLDHGKMQLIGPTEEIIAAYTQQVNGGAEQRKAA